ALLQAVAERALAHAHLPGDLPDRGAVVPHGLCDHDLLLSQFGHLCPPCVKSSRRVPNSPNSARGGCVKLGVSRGARWRDSLHPPPTRTKHSSVTRLFDPLGPSER